MQGSAVLATHPDSALLCCVGWKRQYLCLDTRQGSQSRSQEEASLEQAKGIQREAAGSPWCWINVLSTSSAQETTKKVPTSKYFGVFLSNLFSVYILVIGCVLWWWVWTDFTLRSISFWPSCWKHSKRFCFLIFSSFLLWI